jgi:hypothetical protein
MPFVSSTLKSFEKWRSTLSGATGNFNHQILPYGILFLTSLAQMSFIYCHLNFHANLLRPWPFPLIYNRKHLYSNYLNICHFRVKWSSSLSRYETQGSTHNCIAHARVMHRPLDGGVRL